MALVNQKDFAVIAGISRQAIYKAVRCGRLHLTAEGLVDVSAEETKAFLVRHSVQRRRAQRSAEEAFYQTMRQVEAWWEAGGLPEGWAYLALADELDARGRPQPLVFFSPDGAERIPLISDLMWQRGLRLDLERGCAVDADGAQHPLVMRTYGRVGWVKSAVAKRQQPETPVAVPAQTSEVPS